jgi:hypothetical protein
MEGDAVQIRVDELRSACSLLLDEVESRFGSDVVLCSARFSDDHYWSLDIRAAFGLVEHPEFHVQAGQTSDDAKEVQDLLERAEGEVFLWHDLEHLAAVLLRLASRDTPR